MRPRAILGVLAGGLVDMIATIVLTIPLGVYVVISRGLLSLPSDELEAAIMAAFVDDAAIQVGGWLLGLAASAVGGYVAAWIGRGNAALQGALSAWYCVGLGVVGLVGGVGSAPVWQHLLAFVLAPTFGAAGGLLRYRHVLRQQLAASARAVSSRGHR